MLFFFFFSTLLGQFNWNPFSMIEKVAIREELGGGHQASNITRIGKE
jgi:hypothetical protein